MSQVERLLRVETQNAIKEFFIVVIYEFELPLQLQLKDSYSNTIIKGLEGPVFRLGCFCIRCSLICRCMNTKSSTARRVRIL
ncbi:hypothetical protein Ahy_B09g098236 isoform E [Arachis hypogaea]|uniref:Uncharacterized protein n=1 Tax=Arachis hypogaea TaxID=3818 RepID=A0A444XRE8_ARAHY|nr:hypothetical protein Ahy_B09g098236 isoform E [Arachis hypogaea]